MKQKITALLLCACLAALPLAGCVQQEDTAAPPVEEAAAVRQPETEEEALEPEVRQPTAGESAGSPVLDAIANSWSAKNFTAGDVEAEKITQILQAGAKAPSARNTQPWHFTVITEEEPVTELISGAAQGNVVILISGVTEAQEGVDVAFDCGLATANMYLAAQSLGLGAHIYTGPVRTANENREALGIPDGYEAVALLCIGYEEDGVDASTSASERLAVGDIVTYLD